jgi:hypothetical protein
LKIFFLKKNNKCALRLDRSAVFYFLRLRIFKTTFFSVRTYRACSTNPFFFFFQRGLGWRVARPQPSPRAVSRAFVLVELLFFSIKDFFRPRFEALQVNRISIDFVSGLFNSLACLSMDFLGVVQ